MKRDEDVDDDRPTRAECERDEQHRKPYVMSETEAANWRRSDIWSKENERR